MLIFDSMDKSFNKDTVLFRFLLGPFPVGCSKPSAGIILGREQAEEAHLVDTLHASHDVDLKDYVQRDLQHLRNDTFKKIENELSPDVDVALEDVLTKEREEILSRLHSTVSEEEISRLVDRGYGSPDRIREVRADAQRLVKLALSGRSLTLTDYARLNGQANKARPYYDVREGRWTYVVVEGQPIDLWFAMFGQYLGSGRMRECEYEKCLKIYVHEWRGGGNPPRFCSKSCLNKYKVGYVREWRKKNSPP